MKCIARNIFCDGFIQFISCLLIDKIESKDVDTFNSYVIPFPKSIIGIQFNEACFIYNRIGQHEDFKNRELKFLLFGIANYQSEVDKTNKLITISPLNHVITEQDFAVVLCNRESIISTLEGHNFDHSINQIKLEYFRGSIQTSNTEFDRKTINNLNLKFSTKLKPNMQINEDSISQISRESLLSSVLRDSIDSEFDNSNRRRTNSLKCNIQRLCLSRDHNDFANINNNHSVKRIFKSKFSYITQMNSRYYDISETDMKEFVSNHIIICGYNKGCNQFIESIREETNIPIVIISDSSKRAEIINATRVYTNTFYFKGNPLTIEHLKNANIAESFHVIIPSKTEDIINENDCNAVIKANMIKQNWPEVKISVEFNSNTKALLIENLINYNVEWNNNSSAYLNKCYIGGKIFSSVLFSRLSAIKSLRIESYQTITALLKYCTCSSNLMIIEIPDDLKQKQELLYGDVKEFLLLNSKISLLSIGVYIPDDDAQRKSYNFDKDANNGNIIFDLEQNSDIVRQSIAVDATHIYDQFISEVKSSRRLIICPYDHFKLKVSDYILCVGELTSSVANSLIRK